MINLTQEALRIAENQIKKDLRGNYRIEKFIPLEPEKEDKSKITEAQILLNKNFEGIWRISVTVGKAGGGVFISDWGDYKEELAAEKFRGTVGRIALFWNTTFTQSRLDTLNARIKEKYKL